jgi:hypothetical protein
MKADIEIRKKELTVDTDTWLVQPSKENPEPK